MSVYTSQIRTTVLSNIGIMRYVMSFGMSEHVKNSSKLYFYTFDQKDLVEIEYRGFLITVTDFPHCGDAFQTIEKYKDRLAALFDNYGLKGKRFLFDAKLLVPVRFSDFQHSHNKELKEDTNMFVLDNSSNDIITENGSVKMFTTVPKTTAIDNSLLALYNNSIYLQEPKSKKRIPPFYFTAFLAAMFSGITPTDIINQIPDADVKAKIYYCSKDLRISSDFLIKQSENLKVDRLLNVMMNVLEDKTQKILGKKEEDVGEFKDLKIVCASELLERGFNTVARELSHFPNLRHIVDLDIFLDVKSMFIRNGALFIVPAGPQKIDHFREMFNSDEIYFLNS